jgi:hypothetical protein
MKGPEVHTILPEVLMSRMEAGMSSTEGNTSLREPEKSLREVRMYHMEGFRPLLATARPPRPPVRSGFTVQKGNVTPRFPRTSPLFVGSSTVNRSAPVGRFASGRVVEGHAAQLPLRADKEGARPERNLRDAIPPCTPLFL